MVVARMEYRDARQVMKDHLRARSAGGLDEDLAENYHPDVVVLTATEVFRGHDGVRKSAHKLWRAVADARAFHYDTVMVDDRFALLEWQAKTEELRITSGVDSYVIEDGRIVAQSIHYTVESLELSVSADALSKPGDVGPSGIDDRARAPELTHD